MDNRLTLTVDNVPAYTKDTAVVVAVVVVGVVVVAVDDVGDVEAVAL